MDMFICVYTCNINACAYINKHNAILSFCSCVKYCIFGG